MKSFFTVNLRLLIISLVFFLASNLFMEAQDIEALPDGVSARIDSLENRVKELENRSTWQKVSQYLPSISGYIQTGYNYNSFGKGTSNFMVKRMRLILTGKPIENLDYRIQFEALSGVNVGGRWQNQKVVQLLDAYVTYRFMEPLQLRVGQFSSPLGYENYAISPLTNATVDYATICSRMVLRNAIGYNYSDFGRDIGIMLMGNALPSSADGHYYLQYNLALTNGHLPSVNDNNKSKDIIAALNIWPVKKLNVKIAYNWGEYTPDSFSGNNDFDNKPWDSVKDRKYIPMHRFIVGAWYNNPSGWDIRSEYGKLSSTCNGTKIADEHAFYILASYHIGKWWPVVRFDMSRDKINQNIADNRDRGLIGCSFTPNKHIRIQLNYLLSHYTHKASVLNQGRRYSNELLIMGLFSF